MNDPIISPWLIYLMGRLDSLGIVATVLAAIFGTTCALLMGFLWIEDPENDERRKIVRAMRVSIAVAAISTLIAMLTPSRKEVITMLVAKETTYGSVEKAVDKASSAFDKIKKDILEMLEAGKK